MHTNCVTTLCEHCGVPVIRTRAKISYNSQWNTGRFCSRKCMYAHRSQPITKQTIERRSIPEPNSGCWIWLDGLFSGGYGCISFMGKPVAAHRASYELYCGPIPDKMLIRHGCDNRACVNPDHLKIGTVQDNSDDMVARGRSAHGHKNGRAKITDTQVISILTDDRPVKNIAREYGISRHQVWRIKSGRRHIGAVTGIHAEDARCVAEMDT